MRNDILGMTLEANRVSVADRVKVLKAQQALQVFASKFQAACDDTRNKFLRDNPATLLAAAAARVAEAAQTAQRARDLACHQSCSGEWRIWLAASGDPTRQLRILREKARIAERARIDFNVTANAVRRARTKFTGAKAAYERALRRQRSDLRKIDRFRHTNPPQTQAANTLEQLNVRNVSSRRRVLEKAINDSADLEGKLAEQRVAYVAANRERAAAERATAELKGKADAAKRAYDDCVRACPTAQPTSIDLKGIWKLKGDNARIRLSQAGSTVSMTNIDRGVLNPSFMPGDQAFVGQITGRNLAGRIALRLSRPEDYAKCTRTYWRRASMTISVDGKRFSGTYADITIDLETCAATPTGRAPVQYDRVHVRGTVY